MELQPPSYKVVVLGDSLVGKTSLVHRFTTDLFDTDLANTIGAAYITKDYKSNVLDRKLKFEIWDTAGQERYRSLTPMYYRNSKVALVCYDLTNIDDSFAKAKYWIDQLKLNNETTGEDQIRIVIVGTKKDLVDSSNTTIVKDFIEANPNTKHFTTSAKKGDGINEIFDDIIDSIPEEYFTNYYEQQRLESENSTRSQSINFLNNQFTNPRSNCC